MSALWTIFRRDLALLLFGAPGRGGALLPLLFLLAVAMHDPVSITHVTLPKNRDLIVVTSVVSFD